MLTFVIGSLVVIMTFVVGGLFAFLTSRMDTTVTKTKAHIAEEERAFRPGATMGYEINTTVGADEQVREARTLAAKKAAATPRGANFKVGNSETANPTLATASKGVEEDPWTAAKIAKFHGWDGARTGIPAGGAVLAAAPVAAASAAGGKIVLVPGKDYPYTELTDAMSPDEKRKARIANSKAKSAAMKAAKAAGVTAAPVAVAGVVAAAPVATPVSVDVEAPVLIAMTDDMAPDEKRKARIANSKAKSKFNKALKAAGVDPKTVKFGDDGKVIWPQGAPPAAAAPIAPVAAAQPVAAAPEPVAAPGAASDGAVDLAALGIDPPQMVELTDDMSPDEKRQARIGNSKAKSAFNKALKAAGIDPKSVKL